MGDVEAVESMMWRPLLIGHHGILTTKEASLIGIVNTIDPIFASENGICFNLSCTKAAISLLRSKENRRHWEDRDPILAVTKGTTMIWFYDSSCMALQFEHGYSRQLVEANQPSQVSNYDSPQVTRGSLLWHDPSSFPAAGSPRQRFPPQGNFNSMLMNSLISCIKTDSFDIDSDTTFGRQEPHQIAWLGDMLFSILRFTIFSLLDLYYFTMLFIVLSIKIFQSSLIENPSPKTGILIWSLNIIETSLGEYGCYGTSTYPYRSFEFLRSFDFLSSG